MIGKIVMILVMVAFFPVFGGAGSLTPPGAPAPTGIPLAKVEPRVALSITNTPGDADSRYRITLPGSYYLVENLYGPKAASHGIEIAASNVTIDLMGFSVIGKAGCLIGIRTDGQQDNLVIRNGTVTSWPGGGIDLTSGGTGTDSLIEGVIVSGNGAVGIHGNGNAIIRHCVAWENAGVGMWASYNSVFVNCTAERNGGGGFSLADNSRMSGCTASNNTGRGVYALYGSRISDSSFFLNTTDGIFVFDGSRVSNCSSYQNAGNGFVGRTGCLISDCTATFNGLAGISVSSDGLIKDNLCDSNGANGSGAGISCTGVDNRIIGNTCTDNDWGIQLTGAGNICVRNMVGGNTTPNSIVAGNYGGFAYAGLTTSLFTGTTGGVIPTPYPNMNLIY